MIRRESRVRPSWRVTERFPEGGLDKSTINDLLCYIMKQPKTSKRNPNKSPKVVVPMTLDGPGTPQDEIRKDHERHIPFMTIKEVCGILKVSRLTIIRAIRAGRLRASKPGKSRGWRIRYQDFDEFVGGKHGNS